MFRPSPSAPLARFDRLVAAHQDGVYGFALHLTGDADEAADVAQEAFIRLWQKGETVADPAVRGWLFSTARHVAIDRFRKGGRLSGKPGGRCVPETEALWETTADDGPSPHESAEAGDAHAQAFAALATLRDPFRSLVLLRDVHGLSYDEVGQALGLPLTSVKVYLHRARRMLREAFVHRTREAL